MSVILRTARWFSVWVSFLLSLTQGGRRESSWLTTCCCDNTPSSHHIKTLKEKRSRPRAGLAPPQLTDVYPDVFFPRDPTPFCLPHLLLPPPSPGPCYLADALSPPGATGHPCPLSNNQISEYSWWQVFVEKFIKSLPSSSKLTIWTPLIQSPSQDCLRKIFFLIQRQQFY